ncbi:MAG TPA: hypothetical protein ENK66_06875 [Arcobacter sp.]|nr:hypothetical protein [Arcobacter sp.]
MLSQSAAIIFSFFTSIVIVFQFLLISGKPYGHLAMGGKFPGVFSIKLRISAFLQACLLLFMSLVILSNAEVISIEILRSSKLVWFSIGVSFISFVLNIITPSYYERLLWGPVTAILFISSVIVGINL